MGNIEMKFNTKQKFSLYNYKNEYVEHPLWTKEDFDGYEDFIAQMAYKFNGDLKNGYYIEIGAGNYKNQSNTYLLEKKYGWKGVSLDIGLELVEDFNNNRSNICLNENALEFNWAKYLEENNFPKIIDFLSIDIDAVTHDYANLLAFLNLPVIEYKFQIILIEHNADKHHKFEKLKNLQRDILTALGYNLIIRGRCDDLWSLQDSSSVNGFDKLDATFSRNI